MRYSLFVDFLVVRIILDFLVVHITGKTMLCEAMLANGGIINRIGSITNGSTVSDYHEDEKKRNLQ